jgi:hypothetical protein
MNSIDNLKNASSPYKKRERRKASSSSPAKKKKKLLPLLRGRLGGGKLLN